MRKRSNNADLTTCHVTRPEHQASHNLTQHTQIHATLPHHHTPPSYSFYYTENPQVGTAKIREPRRVRDAEQLCKSRVRGFSALHTYSSWAASPAHGLRSFSREDSSSQQTKPAPQLCNYISQDKYLQHFKAKKNFLSDEYKLYGTIFGPKK